MAAIEEIRRAREYYKELREEPPLQEEIISDRYMEYVQEYKPMPVSFDLEIEQPV